jgi:hypothetical protein
MWRRVVMLLIKDKSKRMRKKAFVTGKEPVPIVE